MGYFAAQHAGGACLWLHLLSPVLGGTPGPWCRGGVGCLAAACVRHDEDPLPTSSNIAHFFWRFAFLDCAAWCGVGDLARTLLGLCKHHHATARVVAVRALANAGPNKNFHVYLLVESHNTGPRCCGIGPFLLLVGPTSSGIVCQP